MYEKDFFFFFLIWIKHYVNWVERGYLDLGCWNCESFYFKEEKVYSGTAEAFGKQWQVGDVVGVFLDLIDRTISKRQSLSDSFCRHLITLNFLWITMDTEH